MTSKGIFTPQQAKKEHKHSPRLANELAKVLPLNHHVYDFGCGRGDYIKKLQQLGFRVTGYEGTEGMSKLTGFELIKQADITKPIKTKKGSVICLEVLEHIEPELTDAAISNLVNACSGRMVLSWAVVGQGGCGHVNEQNATHVIPRIEQEGFELNESLSKQLREVAGADLWWFKGSIYVFDKIKK